MKQTRADFVILGTTPLAMLLAGLLQSRHGKAVLLAGADPAGPGLPLGLDLSIAPLTRPESWALLSALVPETLRLLGHIGRGLSQRQDCLWVAETPSAADALAHMRHMALAFGHGAEPVPASDLEPGQSGMVLRDASLLRRGRLDAALQNWLDRMELRRLQKGETLTIHEDGRATLSDDSGWLPIGRVILADDAAILNWLQEEHWPSLLRRRKMSALLLPPPVTGSEPMRPMVRFLAGGVTFARQDNGAMLALAPGAPAEAAHEAARLLGRSGLVEVFGHKGFDALVTADAAPALGRVGSEGPDLLAGLGETGIFLVPALARWLCGSATAAETAWIEARRPDRDVSPSLVAEYGARP